MEMATNNLYNTHGCYLEKTLQLRTSPIAIKFLAKEEDTPPEAIRPKRDKGMHLAVCQAFAMVRRQQVTLAMFKDDHWCWAPLIGYGLVQCDEGDPSFHEISRFLMMENAEAAKKHLAEVFPRVERGQYAGFVCGPLGTAGFEPDLALIYSNTAQLRHMLLAVKYKCGSLVTSQFDPIDSCVYSVVPVLQGAGYRITIPDPGEYERAMAGEDEIIFSVRKEKLPELIEGLKHFEENGRGYTRFVPQMAPDFPRPPFYNELYRQWGLETTK
jgi:uncharacterized protein (DUF169 family)